ncbi:solute carrier family 2, facilitated glucose transporter member 6 isoform X1 [Hypanus sabinus]|uniref:solute carrier family 2, facilitated glucose transporter member 6 isoform X1 n=2 Tax=Hypanus sabinus TaxID=79690 RepID=UPI0028C3970A|nr:solute carrier family 2, facilitated glucose transporter member 6 isoform X1 [Hypanus sabinus]
MRNASIMKASPPQYNTFRDIEREQEPQTGKVNNRRMFLAVFTAVLGNVSFGYAMVYTSPVVPELEHSPNPNLQMNTRSASLFESVFTLGTALGGLSAMFFNDLLGRKLTIMVSTVPSALGFVLMGSAQAIWMLDVGRALTGFAGGMAASSIPVYISEISVAKLRGRLGSTPQFMLVCGSLLLYALDLALSWRWLAVVGTIIPVVLVIILCFMPESPRYLVSKDRDSEAVQALMWLRGSDFNYLLEYREIQEALDGNVKKVSCTDLRQAFVYKPMLITVVMRVFQQLSGITPILINMQLIFDSTAVILKGSYDAVLVGAIRLVSVSIAAWIMDKAGRRKLLFASGIIMFISTLTFGVYVKVNEIRSNVTNVSTVESGHFPVEHLFQTNTEKWLTLIPLISIMVYIFGYALGWGPVTWLLMSEILPIKVRGLTSGLCVIVSYITAFIITKWFLPVKKSFGLSVPFFFFCVISIFALIFTAFCVPETKGKTLEQLEDEFRNLKDSPNDDNS